MLKSSRGFTLIEILLVIGLISILAAIVIVAINPARQFAQARNTQRSSDVNAILNAVHQNMIDNRGNWNCTTFLPTSATAIASSVSAGDICECLVDIYLPAMPFDPSPGHSYTDCSDYDTGYDISQSSGGRITVSAPSAEDTTISVTR